MISLTAISKHYGRQTLLDEISLLGRGLPGGKGRIAILGASA